MADRYYDLSESARRARRLRDERIYDEMERGARAADVGRRHDLTTTRAAAVYAEMKHRRRITS